MKRLFSVLLLVFIFGEQIFACGGCLDSGLGFATSNASIQNLLQEETRTATQILKEAQILAQSMSIEKSNNISLEKIEQIEKETLINVNKEIFYLQQQNKLESFNVDVKATQ